MASDLYKSEQDSTISELRALQMAGQGYGPNLVQDEATGSATETVKCASPAEREERLEEQAIAEMFKSVTSRRDDDLNRLLAEGSEPKLV